MKIRCVWEHNGSDSLLYAENFVGAYTRGGTQNEAVAKMPFEIASYLKWRGMTVPDLMQTEIVQEKQSDLTVSDADSDVIFDSERRELSFSEYEELKSLAMRSAQDFLTLYRAVPNINKSCLPARTTFYGSVPRTAYEMYEHTKNVNSYYFGEIGIEVDNIGDIAECRKRGFALLERQADYLKNSVFCGSYDEEWSLRKVLRRFVWHDRIHAKAMYRMAVKTFGKDSFPNIFFFDL